MKDKATKTIRELSAEETASVGGGNNQPRYWTPPAPGYQLPNAPYEQVTHRIIT